MPVDRGEIDAQLREIGEGERWWEMREFRDLPHVLHPGERILGLTVGRLLGRRRPRLSNPRWLFVATNDRLICLQQRGFARKQVEIVAGQVLRIGQSSGFRSFQISVHTPQRRYRLRIAKEDAVRFLSALAPLAPRPMQTAVHPDLEPLAWIPGIEAVASMPVVSGIITRVSMLSPPEYVKKDQLSELQATVEKLQHDVERLQQHVDFLEDLLEKRAKESFLPAAATD